MGMQWYGDRVEVEVKGHLKKSVENALKFSEDELKHKCSTPGPSPSPPGEYPHRQTGALVDSIYYEIDSTGLSGKFGADVEHAPLLEFGTYKMQPRPFMSKFVAEYWTDIKRRAERKMK